MTNAEVFAKTVSDWISPILANEINSNLAKVGSVDFSKYIPGFKLELGDILQDLIPVEDTILSIKEHVIVPKITEFVGKIPDKAIPNIFNDILEAMEKKRIKDGMIEVLSIELHPGTFKALKKKFNENLKKNEVVHTVQKNEPEPNPEPEVEHKPDPEARNL